MRKKQLTAIIIASAFICIIAIPERLLALTAKEIIDRAENAIRGDSMVSLVEMTIKTRRWTRTMKIKSWDNRIAKKSFAEILSPKKDAGNRFLMIKSEKLMWHYNPDIGKEMKIHPSMMLQSWMGSDFTNDDIVKESSIIDDYTHTLEGKKTIDGYECYAINMTPKPDAAVVWGKMIYYARASDCLPVRQEFYDQHGKLKKLLTCGNFKTMSGRLIPTTLKMVTMKKKREGQQPTDEYTLMEIKDVRFNVKIPNRMFSLQNLKRR
ncbi:MAG: outer membrane lipoprotein-sorting protein [Spirochaetes bacterium]|nr:outer membrane lipoprotein-sorting protein [Spirochaetota bacterium]